ncbi:MAG: ABC transporter permease [Planctomycetes bacterium]|nr:ABC transporter permease [Planctomycetota bacterium]
MAIPIGIYSAWRPYTVADHTLTVTLFVLYSMPSFWTATMLLLGVCREPAPSLMWLGFLFLPYLLIAIYAMDAAPTRGWKTGSFLVVGVLLPAIFVSLLVLLCWAGQQAMPDRPVQLRFPIGASESHEIDALSTIVMILHRGWHYTLPVFCLVYGGFAFLSRQMRAGMMECVRQDYIRTARAKGLPESRVILKHALRNSLIPIITLLGTLLPALLGGSVIIEAIFGIRGMGLLIYEAIINRDYPIVTAEVFVAAVLTLVGLLISDLLYVLVNPTISYDKAAS